MIGAHGILRVVPMTKAQIELLARLIRDGQAKLVERGGKIVPVSLI